MMSMKKFKDLSSFGFTTKRGENSTVIVLNPNTSNNLDTIEVATDISCGTSDPLFVSSINNHVSPNKQPAAALPVTTATGERSFPTLKLLKTYLRSTMSENCLNGLAIMNIHAMINIDIEQLIDKFSERKNRKLEFLI